jgi:hypothetical protein
VPIEIDGFKFSADPEFAVLLAELNKVGLQTYSHCAGHDRCPDGTRYAWVVLEMPPGVHLEIRDKDDRKQIVLNWKRPRNPPSVVCSLVPTGTKLERDCPQGRKGGQNTMVTESDLLLSDKLWRDYLRIAGSHGHPFNSQTTAGYLVWHAVTLHYMSEELVGGLVGLRLHAMRHAQKQTAPQIIDVRFSLEVTDEAAFRAFVNHRMLLRRDPVQFAHNDPLSMLGRGLVISQFDYMPGARFWPREPA